MIITKKWTYEMSHRVVGAFTKRCSENIHGHSYDVELRLTSNKLDVSGMVVDFGLLKLYMGPFIDVFDHSHMVWYPGPAQKEYEFITRANARWIAAPFSSTAEIQAKMFCAYAQYMLKELSERNLVEPSVRVHSVTVHETRTGSATCEANEFPHLVSLSDIVFSEGCQKDWSPEFKDFYKKVLQHEVNSGHGSVAIGSTLPLMLNNDL